MKQTAEYFRNRRKQRTLKIYNEVGNCCVKCGNFEGDVDLLELHHIDASKKSFEVNCSTNGSIDKLIEEAKKCIPLCPTCHRLYHLGRYDYSDIDWNLLKEFQLKQIFLVLSK